MQHGDGVDHQQPGLKQRVQRERHGPAAGTEGGKGSEREGREGKGPAAERDVAGRGGAGRGGTAPLGRAQNGGRAPPLPWRLLEGWGRDGRRGAA